MKRAILVVTLLPGQQPDICPCFQGQAFEILCFSGGWAFAYPWASPGIFGTLVVYFCKWRRSYDVVFILFPLLLVSYSKAQPAVRNDLFHKRHILHFFGSYRYMYIFNSSTIRTHRYLAKLFVYVVMCKHGIISIACCNI